ncbi:MAG: hypothetical protein Tsb0013_05190 [Phycisphaerales bacterium]
MLTPPAPEPPAGAGGPAGAGREGVRGGVVAGRLSEAIGALLGGRVVPGSGLDRAGHSEAAGAKVAAPSLGHGSRRNGTLCTTRA